MTEINIADLASIDWTTLSASDYALMAQQMREAEANYKAKLETEFQEKIQLIAEHVAAHGTIDDKPGRVWAGVTYPSTNVVVAGVTYAVNVSLTDIHRKAVKGLEKAQQVAVAVPAPPVPATDA